MPTASPAPLPPPVDPSLATVRRAAFGSILASLCFFGTLGSAVGLIFGLKALFTAGDIPKRWRLLALFGTLLGLAGLGLMAKALLHSGFAREP